MVMYCCYNTKLKDIRLRINPSTGDQLILCQEHAYMHDEGFTFPVTPHPSQLLSEILNPEGDDERSN